MKEKPRYGIVGDGRLARHLGHYLTLMGVPFVRWSRREAALTGGTPAPESALAGCEIILLAVTDSAIEPLIRKHFAAREGGPLLVHFSGALVTGLAHGLHPLMTFGPDLHDLAFYLKIPFVTDAGGPSFGEIFPGLSNVSFAIPAEQRPLYHALCVLAGNFTTLLWRKASLDFERRLDLPPRILAPYLEAVLRNAVAAPGAALTGPLARRDFATIASNLQALDGDPYREVYEAFLRVELGAKGAGAA